MKLILKKLIGIQTELKAPKGQLNKFGGYKYRSCEDILEAVKPLLAKREAVLVVSDAVVQIEGRFYVEATATLWDVETGDCIAAKALAREEESKKGMDGSQVTGAASSYARKYALNGLFAIDDTKDSDHTNVGEEKPSRKQNVKIDRDALYNEVKERVANGSLPQSKVVEEIKKFGVKKMDELNDEQFISVVRALGLDVNTGKE